MDPEIRKRVLSLNPWLTNPAAFDEEVAVRVPAPYLARDVAPGAVVEPHHARLVVGPRQAGKSTLVWGLFATRDSTTVLFLNAEERLVRRWCDSAAGFLADLRRDLPDVCTVLLDEAQHLEEAGLFVKGVVDACRGIEMYVTG